MSPSLPPRLALQSPLLSPNSGHRGGPAPQRFLRALQCFGRICAATQPLAEWIAEVHPAARVGVFSSGLGPSWIASADALSADPAGRAAYLALAPVSDVPLDPELLRAVIPEVIQRSPRLRLVPHDALNPFLPPAAIGRAPRALKPPGLLALTRHCHTIAFACGARRADLTLPAARALEAAFLGCRVLAPPLPDFLNHREAGFVFLDSPDAWIDALLGPPRQSRVEIAATARAHIVQSGTSVLQSRRLLEWVEAEPA